MKIILSNYTSNFVRCFFFVYWIDFDIKRIESTQIKTLLGRLDTKCLCGKNNAERDARLSKREIDKENTGETKETKLEIDKEIEETIQQVELHVSKHSIIYTNVT